MFRSGLRWDLLGGAVDGGVGVEIPKLFNQCCHGQVSVPINQRPER